MSSLMFRLARAHELPAVLALWEDAKREPFSVWNEEYPGEIDAVHDLETANLYVLVEQDGSPDGHVIGTLAVCPENEMDELTCFSPAPDAREIARIAVASDHHGHGYAALMVKKICAILGERGISFLRLSVAKDNIPARRTYPRVGFLEVGEATLYGGQYLLMEKSLTSDKMR